MNKHFIAVKKVKISQKSWWVCFVFVLLLIMEKCEFVCTTPSMSFFEDIF